MALTRDHTVVNDQVRLGVMTAREAAKAETRHILSRSLGLDLFVSVDTSEHHVMVRETPFCSVPTVYTGLYPERK